MHVYSSNSVDCFLNDSLTQLLDLAPHFKWGQQADAHEFLLHLWIRLTQCDKYFEDEDNEHKILVTQLFGGRLVNKVISVFFTLFCL